MGTIHEFKHFTAESCYAGKRKTAVYIIYAKMADDPIGMVSYHPHWRTWVFSPNERTIWDSDCLEDVRNLIEFAGDEYAKRKAMIDAAKRKKEADE